MDLSTPPAGLSVLFATSECAPLAKTGGLGDVCAALPPALRALGVDVRVLLPGYPEVLRVARGRQVAAVAALGHEARLLEARLPGEVPLFVLDCQALYDRPGGPYQDEAGRDWPDNALRFGFFSRIAARLAGPGSPLAWRPQVVHCNDWQTALVPAFAAQERAQARTVLTIHNLAFQGNFERGVLAQIALPESLYAIEGLEFYGKASFLKGGLMAADALTTVSPTYAREIQGAEFGCGMEGILRRRSGVLAGVLNGIDTSAWDPARDPHLACGYDAKTLGDKKKNKEALQRALGLEPRADVPLFGTVGRMTPQKGTDLILALAPRLAQEGQLALVGTGERGLEDAARSLAARFPGRIAVRIGFSEPLAHLLEAGSDLFLMPSRYEPCGLNQMYSQRYGTPPVARATGGLADTIEDGKTGFLFAQPREEDFLAAIAVALSRYRDPAAWRAVQRAGMARDFSWAGAARRYEALYLRLAAPQPA